METETSNFKVQMIRDGAFVMKASNISRKLFNILPVKSIEPPKHRGVGFNHFIADEEAIYFFWLLIKDRDIFEESGNIVRRKLIDNFLIQYGHHRGSCYRFISRLVKKGLFEETDYINGKRSDLVISQKFQEIVNEMEKKQPKSNIKKQPLQRPPNNDRIALISQKEKQVKAINLEIRNLIKELILEKKKEVEALEARLEALS